MIDIDDIFKYKIPNKDKLLKYGFTCSQGAYTKNIPIMDNTFIAKVFVKDKEKVSYKVYETDTDEEYVLVHIDGAEGGFVGKVRNACEKVLVDISENCFDIELLKAEQTKRMIEFIKESFNIEPDFLWEKTPDFAAFRLKKNKKWFALIGTIDKNKIDGSEKGKVEFINLKDNPQNVGQRVDEKKFYKAYHMNKKHWYTICLDGTVSDEEIKSLIQQSYELVSGK